MARPLVVGLGRASVAMVGRVPRLPEHEARLELSEISVQAGGTATIAAATVVAMGCKARLATKVADDFLGPFILEALRQSGLDVRKIVAKDARLSAFEFTVSASEPARRTTFVTHGDAGPVAADEINVDALLEGAGATLVDGAFPEAQVALAEAARARDIPVVLGGAQMREGIGELVGLADVLICSERFASELAPRGEVRDSLIELQKLGPRAVIITLGESGSVGLHGDQLVEQAPFPVEPVDDDGAGDVYLGAFVTALLNSLPFARCMEYASAAAALSCRHIGAWAGIPEQDEVVELIRINR